MKLGTSEGSQIRRDFIYPGIIMVLMGGFFWAIQGTGGYGGAPGGAYAGLGFGILWLYFSRKTPDGSFRPYHSGLTLFAIVAGLALGGTVGFGIYGGWIQNHFYYTDFGDFLYMPEAYRGWIGYFLTGFQWGGFGGIFLAYTDRRNPQTVKIWGFRVMFGILGGVAGYIITTQIPSFFFPFYDEGFYIGDSLSVMIVRVVETVIHLGVYIGIFLGLLLYAIIRKQWKTVFLSLMMSGLFGFALSLNAYWFIIGARSAWPIDWWKNWEMSNGCWIGGTFALCNYLFNKSIPLEESQNRPLGAPVLQKKNKDQFMFHSSFLLTVNFITIAAFRGFYQDREMKLIFAIFPVLLVFIISTIYFIKMIRDRGIPDGEKGLISTRFNIPYLSTQLYLIGLGYLVSIPGEKIGGITFAHWLLLLIYSILLSLAIGIFFVMKKKHPKR